MSEECPDGQLCPYKDCAHDLALSEQGWYSCGHCGRLFFAEVSDSDYEDFRCYRLDERKDRFPDPPPEIPAAKDLGPSWATP